MKRLLNLKQAAKILMCSERTVRRLVENGELKACKIRGLKIDAEYLDLYIKKKIFEYELDHGKPEFFVTDDDRV